MFFRAFAESQPSWLRAADDAASGGGDPSPDPAAGGEAGEAGGDVGAGDPASSAEQRQGTGQQQEADSGDKKPEGKKPAPTDWRERRLAQVTAQKKDLEARLAALQQQQGQQAPDGDKVSLTAEDVERLANEKAAAIAAATDFNRRCEAAALDGYKAFGEAEFKSRVNALVQLRGDSPAEQAAYNAFLDAALETGEAPRLIHDLGGDLNEAARILALPPARMAVALTRLAGTAKDPGTSRAPKPITPVGSPGGARDRISAGDKDRADKLDTATWMARREEELKARRSAA